MKAGKNDCGTKAHSCAAQAKKDGMADEWIYLPKGSCSKLVGGSTTSAMPEMDDGKKLME